MFRCPKQQTGILIAYPSGLATSSAAPVTTVAKCFGVQVGAGGREGRRGREGGWGGEGGEDGRGGVDWVFCEPWQLRNNMHYPGRGIHELKLELPYRVAECQQPVN